jgi:signal transduction histidine kinase
MLSSLHKKLAAISDGSNNTITVFARVESDEANKKRINGSKEAKVIISIKDRGTGIDSDEYDKLFSKFVTNSETGSGSGFFISKGTIEAHGGRIWAENNSNRKGATFYFSLLVSNDKQQPQPTTTKEATRIKNQIGHR